MYVEDVIGATIVIGNSDLRENEKLDAVSAREIAIIDFVITIMQLCGFDEEMAGFP